MTAEGFISSLSPPSTGLSSTTALLLLLHVVGAALLVTKQMVEVLMVEVVEDVETYWSNIRAGLSTPTTQDNIAKITTTVLSIMTPPHLTIGITVTSTPFIAGLSLASPLSLLVVIICKN